MYLILIIPFLILFLSHYALYRYLLRFLSLEDKKTKRILFSLTIILPVLFIITLVGMQTSSAFLVRAMYFVMGLWHGVLVNCLMVIFLSWIIVGVLKMLRIKIDAKIFLRIALFGLALVVLVSVYGVFNVYNVQTKNISLDIENLPESWKGKKAVHITDVHLGAILRDGHMQRIVKEVDKVKPDIIFITGDLFDSIDGNIKYFQDSLKSLSAPLGVFFVTGNHETYLGVETAEQIFEGTNIIMLDNELAEIDGVQIVGIAYPEEARKKNIVESIKGIEGFSNEKTNILLNHEPIEIEGIKNLGIDLMLTGHSHKGQMWPFNYITNSLFKGYDYGFFKEGDFHLYASCGVGVWGPTMRTSGHSEVVVINF